MSIAPKKLALPLPVAAAVLLLALAAPLAAVRQPDPDPLSEKAYRHPGLTVGNLLKAPADLPAAVATRAAADLATLGVAADHARLDRRTDRWGTLLPVERLLAETSADAGTGDLERSAWAALRAWITRYQGALRIDPEELREPAHVTVHRAGGLIQVHAPRVVAGIPVRDSYLTAVISQGKLVLFGAHNWGTIGELPAPVLSPGDAFERMQAHVGALAASELAAKTALELIPLAVGDHPDAASPGQGLEYRLAWVVQPRYAGSLARWEALVDAVSGELIAFEDKTAYATTRRVIGGVYPVSNDGVAPDGVEQVYPLPYADVEAGGETFYTDAGGNLHACLDGTITTNLSGPYLTMIDSCGAVVESTAGSVLDLGTSGGDDCTVPAGHSAGDTHATRSGFYEINRIIEMGRGQLPNSTWLRQPMPATMNINQVCNANWDGFGVNFFRSGGGCANTGELAGVFDHEWGHGMDDNDANPSISNPGEGIADIYASLRLSTSCIGRNFFLGSNCGGYGDPCTSCSGIRDIDWAKRASGLPHGIPFIDANCGSGPAPCGGGVHCEGAVYSEAVWDLWNRDLPSEYGMSLDTSRELATRLTFVGAQLVGTWYNCVNGTGTGDGCNASGGYLNYLAADDDDANLTNGTPHMNAIFDAFNRHGIACPTPTVQDSGCAGAPVTAPVVSATALDRGAHLSWGAVAGADAYRVYRTEGEFGCAFGKTLVGETTATSFIDTDGLANGREYSYIVFAMGDGDTCFGPASACTDVTPAAGPNLGILPRSASTTFDGDGDGFVDNCEHARVTLEVDNIGNGSQTNVRIVSVASPSHPALDATVSIPPVAAASLAACGRAVAGFDFRPVGLSFDDVVLFDVALTSDELEAQLPGQIKTTTVSIGFTESDLQALASQTFTYESGTDAWTVASGTFTRSGAGGAQGTTFSMRSSAFLNDRCDRIRSPLMQLGPTSTLTLWNNFDIEPFGPIWWDRANVAIRGVSGARTVVQPSGGRLYNASGAGDYAACNSGEAGWGGTQASWAASAWDAASFGALAPVAELAQIEVTYATDAAVANAGFWFDQVTVTDLSLQVADAQGDVCAPSSLIFADDYESGGPFFWDSTVP